MCTYDVFLWNNKFTRRLKIRRPCKNVRTKGDGGAREESVILAGRYLYYRSIIIFRVMYCRVARGRQRHGRLDKEGVSHPIVRNGLLLYII